MKTLRAIVPIDEVLGHKRVSMKHVKPKGDESKAYRVGNTVRVSKWKDKSWSATSNWGHDEVNPGDSDKALKKRVSSDQRRSIRQMVDAARAQIETKKAGG